MLSNELKKIAEEISPKDKQTRKQIKSSLEDALTYLGYIAYDPEWKKYNSEALKAQLAIEKLYKKIK